MEKEVTSHINTITAKPKQNERLEVLAFFFFFFFFSNKNQMLLMLLKYFETAGTP